MKSAIGHGVAAAIAVFLAWQAWTDEESEEGSQETVAMYECDAVGAVSYATKQRTVRVERQGSGDDAFAWITLEPRAEDQVSDAAPPEPTQYLANVKTDPAGERPTGTEWLDKFAPLEATRSLGTVDEELLTELELNDEAPILEVTCGSQTLRYRVGTTTFGARGQRYLQSADGGDVYLVDAELLNQLSSAEASLVQRTLFTFEPQDVDRVRLSGDGREMTLLQRDRLNADAAVWVDANDPERRNDLYGNWMSRLDDLTVATYLPLDAEPGSDLDETGHERINVFTIEYKGEGGDDLDRLELVRIMAEEPAYYARSSTTRGWVKVAASVARQVENDGRQVLGMDPLPEPPPPIPTTPDAGVPVDGSAAADPAADPHGADPHGHGADPHEMPADPHAGIPNAPPLNAPTMAPAMIEAPTMAPAMIEAPTMVPAMIEAPAMGPAMIEAPTMAPAMVEATPMQG
jgi:hypothetical protein